MSFTLFFHGKTWWAFLLRLSFQPGPPTEYCPNFTSRQRLPHHGTPREKKAVSKGKKNQGDRRVFFHPFLHCCKNGSFFPRSESLEIHEPLWKNHEKSTEPWSDSGLFAGGWTRGGYLAARSDSWHHPNLT